MWWEQRIKYRGKFLEFTHPDDYCPEIITLGKPLRSKGVGFENIFGNPLLKLASEMIYEPHKKIGVVTGF